MTLSASDAVPLPAACSGTVGGSRRTRLASPCISFLLLLIFLDASSAQLDPVKNFCRRFGHQTAVIDRKLYIDGGFMNFNPLSQYPTNYSNTGLHYHDLDTPGAGRMPQLYANLTKNASIPSVSGGALWADNVNKRFYLFAGEYYQQPPSPQFTLWSFDTIYNSWDSFGSPPQDDISAISYGAGVSVSETGQGYYYGGWKSNNTIPGWTGPPKAMSALVKYSMDSNTWSTDTGPDSVGRAEGVMVFIPVGDGGMLVYFGGVQDPDGNGTWVGQPMDNIFLYDVLSSKWYTQNTTGTAPPMRRRFCAGATWAVDQSSYNIYLYGGAGMPPNTAGFDDVYTLSIPSFQWVKMFPTDGNLTGPYVHHSLSCNVIDNAQMIVSGGTFPTSDNCDVPIQYGLHNLDLGQQNQEKALWQIFATNLTQYAVPDRVVSAIGGSAGGGATMTAPTAGFSNPDLRVLMTRKASIPARTPTRSIPTATGTPGQKDTPPSTGAIAGIAVGGAIALIALILALTLLIRRHRRRHNNHNLTHTHSYSQTKHLPDSTSPQEWSPPLESSVTTAYSPNSPHSYNPFFSQQNGSGYRPSQQHQQQLEPAELPVGTNSPRPRGLISWLGPDGVTYESIHPQPPPPSHPAAVQSTTMLTGSRMMGRSNSSTTDVGTGAGTGTSTGTGTGTGTGSSTGGGEALQTKLDAAGRLWVQVPAAAHAGGSLSSSSKYSSHNYNHTHSLSHSPGGGGGGGGGRGISPGGIVPGPEPGLVGLPRYSPVTSMPVTPSSMQQQQLQQPQELSSETGAGGEGWGGGAEEVLGERVGWDAAHGRPRHLTFYHP